MVSGTLDSKNPKLIKVPYYVIKRVSEYTSCFKKHANLFCFLKYKLISVKIGRHVLE